MTTTLKQIVKPQDLLRRVRRNTRQFQREVAEENVEIAQRLVSVGKSREPGHVHLRDTIRAEEERGGRQIAVIAGDASRGVNHAVIVEYGGAYTPANPYMGPAAEMVKREKEKRARHTNFYK